MLNGTEVLLLLGMMSVTFGVRYFPLLTANRVKLPPALVSGLKYIPVAVLSAIVSVAVLIPDGEHLNFSLENPHLLTAIVASLVAYFSKHLMLTVVSGLIVFAGLRIFAGL